MLKATSWLLAGLFAGALLRGADAVTVRPDDTGAALVNPGMGWTFHFYSNRLENYGSKLDAADTLDDWPGLSTVYLRLPWAYLEPKEGEYNWSVLDTPAQRWIARGRRIALRITCSESGIRHATPEWVRAAGAKGVDYEFRRGPVPGGRLWDPDYLDPVFLEKLERFVAALARRYDGNPHVAFVDIGSFGLWGEGHTLLSSKLTDAQTLAVAQRHIDLYVKHFSRTLLCLSDDVAGPTRPGRNFPAIDYARARGVTLRDDSILVAPPPRSWFHAEMAAEFWPTRPVILEHQHFDMSRKSGAWRGDLLEKAVEEYHASYLSIHGWPRELLGENRATVERINRRLGYRIQLREIALPAAATLGEPFTVSAAWANAGVAPCYAGGYWACTLKDARGGIAAVHVDEDFDFARLPIGPPGQAPATIRERRITVALGHADPLGWHAPATPPGTYDVFVSVGQRDGTPVIALPLAGDDGRRRYRIGQLVLAPRIPAPAGATPPSTGPASSVASPRVRGE